MVLDSVTDVPPASCSFVTPPAFFLVLHIHTHYFNFFKNTGNDVNNVKLSTFWNYLYMALKWMPIIKTQLLGGWFLLHLNCYSFRNNWHFTHHTSPYLTRDKFSIQDGFRKSSPILKFSISLLSGYKNISYFIFTINGVTVKSKVNKNLISYSVWIIQYWSNIPINRSKSGSKNQFYLRAHSLCSKALRLIYGYFSGIGTPFLQRFPFFKSFLVIYHLRPLHSQSTSMRHGHLAQILEACATTSEIPLGVRG